MDGVESSSPARSGAIILDASKLTPVGPHPRRVVECSTMPRRQSRCAIPKCPDKPHLGILCPNHTIVRDEPAMCRYEGCGGYVHELHPYCPGHLVQSCTVRRYDS